MIVRPARNARRLRRLRIALALIFFTSLSLLFLDIHTLLPGWTREVGLYFQFLPSLIHLMREPGTAAAGAVAVLVLALVVGRIYCSVLCPLGIFMDLIRYMVKSVKKKLPRPHRFARPHPLLRYGVLAATLFSFAGGTMALVNLLDPFSNFGRMATSLARPLLLGGSNGLARLLELAGNYAIPPVALKGIHPAILAFACGFAALVTGLALARGRLYCNTICPVGTLLGLVGRAAPFRIRIQTDECTGCGRCETRCKSDCIDIKSGSVDQSRCVVCFNCTSACPTGAATFRFRPSPPAAAGSPPHGYPTHTRRHFIAAMAGAAGFLPKSGSGSPAIRVTVPNKMAVPPVPHPILPPGSISLSRFTLTCTGCHACVAHCPTQVLEPAITQYGLTGLFMPFLDPGKGFCSINCTTCSQVCPTTAITPFSRQEKRRIQTGVVKFIRDNCIVTLQKTDCGACAEHCPTKAVAMTLQDKLKLPRINEKICLGCGACEHVCPAKPNKAIYVWPHTIHKTAELPPDEPVQLPGEDVPDSFNF